MSPLSQPSDTITTTAPRPTPRRTQPSLNCLSAAPRRSAGPVRRRGHRRPQGDRRLRRGELTRQPVQRRGEHERLGPQCPYCAVQQVQVGAAIRLHRSRHVGEEKNLARSHPAPAGGLDQVATGPPGGPQRRPQVDRRPRRGAAAAPAPPPRWRHDQCVHEAAQPFQLVLAALLERLGPQPLLGAGGGDDVRPVVTVVRAGFRIVGQPVAAAVGAEHQDSARRPRRRAAPRTPRRTAPEHGEVVAVDDEVARASQNSSSTRWGVAAAGRAAAKRRSSPESPRLLRRVGVRRTAPRSRRDRRSLRSPATQALACRSLAGARSLARTTGTHASPTTQESPRWPASSGPRGT